MSEAMVEIAVAAGRGSAAVGDATLCLAVRPAALAITQRQRRADAEQHAAYQRDAERECEHRAVQPHILESRDVARREGEESAHSKNCEPYAGEPANQRGEQSRDQCRGGSEK